MKKGKKARPFFRRNGDQIFAKKPRKVLPFKEEKRGGHKRGQSSLTSSKMRMEFRNLH